ncbi:MAG: hypothetical protein M3290_02335 [Actinomycetota bacterium]|nr:hypothetical protein [Actinomycetota bacterium]
MTQCKLLTRSDTFAPGITGTFVVRTRADDYLSETKLLIMKTFSLPKRALSALGLASVIAVAAASPALASTFSTPYFSNPQNSCTGDFMLFNGNANVTFDVTQNADGSFHVREHVNTQGVTATGLPSGDEYVISDVTNDVVEFDVSAQPTDSHTVHTLEIIHKANNLPLDDRYEQINVDTTWVDGVPNATVHSEREECR